MKKINDKYRDLENTLRINLTILFKALTKGINIKNKYYSNVAMTNNKLYSIECNEKKQIIFGKPLKLKDYNITRGLIN